MATYQEILNSLFNEPIQPIETEDIVIPIRVDDIDDFDTEYLDDAILRKLANNSAILKEIENIRKCPHGMFAGSCYIWYKCSEIDISFLVKAISNVNMTMNKTKTQRDCLPQFVMILLKHLHPLKLAHLVLQYSELQHAYSFMIKDIACRATSNFPIDFPWPIDNEMEMFQETFVSNPFAPLSHQDDDHRISIDIVIQSDGYLKIHFDIDGEKTDVEYWNKLKAKAMASICCIYNIRQAQNNSMEELGPLMYDIRPHPKFCRFMKDEKVLDISKVLHITTNELELDITKSSQVFTAIHSISSFDAKLLFEPCDDTIVIERTEENNKVCSARKLLNSCAREVLQVIASTHNISIYIVNQLNQEDCYTILSLIQRKPCHLTGLPTKVWKST